MIPPLVAELARLKNKWVVVGLAVSAAAMWLTGGLSGHAGRAFAISMAVAFAVGAGTGHIPRAFWYLPLGRRDVWRANWLLATAGATAVTALPKLLSLTVPLVRESIGLDGTLLSIAWDFAATGFGCGLLIVATMPPPRPRPLRALWPAIKDTAAVLLATGMVIGFYLPLWLGVAVPVRWDQLTRISGGLLFAGLALTIATFFYVPVPDSGRGATPAASAKPARTRFRLPALSGLPRLLWHEFVWTVSVGAVVGIPCAAIVLLMAPFVPRDLMDALDGDLPPAFNLLWWYTFFAATMVARFPPMLRHLRALPLGASRLNALLLGWPLIIGLAASLLLTAVHLVARQALPSSGHVSFFISVVGFNALAQSVMLRAQPRAKASSFAALMSLPLLYLLWSPGASALWSFAIVSFAAAWYINRATLARGATYRIPPNVPLAA